MAAWTYASLDTVVLFRREAAAGCLPVVDVIMAPVNPYLRKPTKNPGVSSQAATASSSQANQTFTTTATKPKPRPVAAVVAPNPPRPPAAATAAPQPRPTAVPEHKKSRPTAVVVPMKPAMVAQCSKRKSFKSKLKQEIEALKRAKQLEQQRKILEEQNRKLEKQRQEQQKVEQERARIQQEQIAKQRQEPLLRQEWMAQGLPSSSYGTMTYGQAPMNAYTTMGRPSAMLANYVTPGKGATCIYANAQGDTPGVPTTKIPFSSHVQVTPNVSSVNPGLMVVAKQTSPPVGDENAYFSPCKGETANPTATIPSASKQQSPAVEKVKWQESSAPMENVNLKGQEKKVASAVLAKPTTDEVTAPLTVDTRSSKLELSTLKCDLTSGRMSSRNASPQDTTEQKSIVGNGLLNLELQQRIVGSNGLVPHANPFLSSTLPVPQYNMPFALPPHMGAALPMYPHFPVMMPAALYGWSSPYPQPVRMGKPSWPQPPAPPMPIPAKTQPNVPKPAILHRDPLSPMSPYADTHQLLAGDVLIFKECGQSFGVSFKYETRSALVDPELWEKMNSQSLKGGSIVKKEKPLLGRAVESKTDDNNLTSSTVEHKNSNDAKPTATNASVKQGSPTMAAKNSTNAAFIANLVDKAPVKQRQRRRRRVFFGVVTVVTAEKQNARFHQMAEDESKHQLKPGDIILKINGHDLGGLTFQEAIGLFGACDGPTEETASSSDRKLSLIQCPLVVARMKPKPSVDWKPALSTGIPPKSHLGHSVSEKIPFVVSTITNQVLSGDFTNAELLALALCALRCVTSEARALGHEVPPRLELSCLQGPALSRRDFLSIKSKQNHAVLSIEQSMDDAARSYWARKWKLEDEKMGESDLQITNLSDAQRSAMRGLPRPARGCRCGSMNHEFVSDGRCILYRNLRALSERPSVPKERSKLARKSNANKLNAIETAFKDRVLKLKEQTEREEEEAQFVEEMEELQVKRLKMAVFVPSLTTMVLSAVAELGKDVPKDDLIVEDTVGEITVISMDKQPTPSTISPTKSSPTTKESMNDVDDCSDDDDDDDDLPLMALIKRDGPSPQEPEAKRLKVQSTGDTVGDKAAKKKSPALNLSFLAKILHQISHTWGHLYTEPPDAEYSW